MFSVLSSTMFCVYEETLMWSMLNRWHCSKMFSDLQLCRMGKDCLLFEHWLLIFKWYQKFKNVLEVQRWWNHFETWPPIWLTQEFGINLEHTVLRKICQQQCGRLHTTTNEDSSAMLLYKFTWSLKKSVKLCASAFGNAKANIHWVLKES